MEQITFINLPQPTLHKLIARPTQLKADVLGPDVETFDANLCYDPRPDAYLGVGSFKTATPACLTFSGACLPCAGLGKLVSSNSSQTTQNPSSSSHVTCGSYSASVALKRPYRTK